MPFDINTSVETENNPKGGMSVKEPFDLNSSHVEGEAEIKEFTPELKSRYPYSYTPSDREVFDRSVKMMTDNIFKSTGGDPVKAVKAEKDFTNLISRAPTVAFAFVSPMYALGFEALQQAKNLVVPLIKQEKEKYSPLETRMITELLPEKIPGPVRFGASIAEWMSDIALMGALAETAKTGLLKNTIKEMGEKLSKAGYGEGKLEININAIRKAARGSTLEAEADRWLKAKSVNLRPAGKLNLLPQFEKADTVKPMPESAGEFDPQEFEKSMSEYMQSESGKGNLYSIIKSEGGIAPYKKTGAPGQLGEEYKENVPIHLRNNNGLSLDEMASVLKERYPYFEINDESGLLDKLGQEKMLRQSGQVDIRLLPGTKELAETLKNSYEELSKVFVPYSKGMEGKAAAGVLREQLGQLARSNDKLEASLADIKNMFGKAAKESLIDFYDKSETDQAQSTEALQKISDALRTIEDTDWQELLKTGKLNSQNYIQNYMPHFWEDPDKAEDVIKSVMSKRPFAGPKSFLKRRVFMTQKEGIDYGLTPVSYNPVDLVLLKHREITRFIAAQNTMKALKEQKIVQFVKLGDDTPEDFVRINDSISEVYSRLETGELVLRGRYYAQRDAARIINNYLSAGLRGNYFYDLYRGSGNVLNQFQLGLSAFHLGFTSMDAMVSKCALGINKLMYGDAKGAALEFAKTPFAPVNNFIQGRKLLQAWYGEDKGELTNTIADIMASAGGRAKMDKFYATHITDSIKKSLQEGKMLKATLKLPWYLIEQASRPIMEYIVPRQKMGVFMDIVKMELERNPNLTHEEMRYIAQKAWDSVDNRMGQLVYDNIFWDKTVKDLSMASVRSLGWNLGTIRELGGGTKDTLELLNDFRQKKKPEFTYRMAYLLALPILAGMVGAIYQYLHTGKGPEELKDYYFPKTGGIDRNGQPQRISLPTYMKDIYHYTQAPVRTVLNKFNPVNSAVLQMLINKDYYGTEIRNVDDPAVQQVLDELGFMSVQFLPFGIRNVQSRKTETSLESKVEPFIGITPAPYDINMTKAEKAAYEMMKSKIPSGARTKEQSRHSQERADLRNQYLQNKDVSVLNQAVADKKITPKEKQQIVKESKMSMLERATQHLSFEEVSSLIKKAVPEEKPALQKILQKKAAGRKKQGRWTTEMEKLYEERIGK